MGLHHFQLIVLLVFFCRPLMAQEKSYVLVRRIAGVEQLPSPLVRQLDRVGLQVITKQPGLELILSGSDTPKGTDLELIAVEPEISRIGDHFRIEARLIDVKTRRLIAKASRDHIREEDLVRLYQGALEAIFAGYSSETEGKEAEPKDKERTPPKERPKQVTNTTTLNTPDQPTIDFRKRISDLKAGVDKEIVKATEKKVDDAAKKKDGASNVSNSVTIAELEADAPEPKIVSPKSLERSHRIELFYEKRAIKSTGLVETNTNLGALTFKGSGDLPRPLLNGRTGFSYEFAYATPQAEEKTPMLYQAGLYGSVFFPKWKVLAGLYRDNTYFVNLAAPGEGLLPSTLTSDWIQVKGEVTLPLKKPWKLAGTYGMARGAQTNYKPLSSAEEWSGTHVNINLTPHFIFYTCELNITLETFNLSTQGEIPFSFQESRLGLALRRSL